MKKILLLLSLNAISLGLNAQYIESSFVVPVTIDSMVQNPELPSGFRLANFGSESQFVNTSMIIDNNCHVIWRLSKFNSGTADRMMNFKRLNDTTLTLFISEEVGGYFLALNNDYSVRDTVRTVNGFNTKPHELLVLPNGNYLTMGKRYDLVPDSLVGLFVKQGVLLDSTSLFENIAIQEFNTDGDLVKEWLSLDHVNPVLIWDTTKINSADKINVIHTNSIDYFTDQGGLKLIVSNRNSNNLFILNWENGDIEEQIGGRTPTMFFIPAPYSNDSLDLYGQHYAKVLNWNEIDRVLDIRLFNNRFNVQEAEGLKLRMYLESGTVYKTFALVSNPAINSVALGNMDLYGSNWLVNWGMRIPGGRENASGYDQYGQKQFDLFFSGNSYRILPIDSSEMADLLSQRPTIIQNGCTLVSSESGYWQDGSYGSTLEVSDTGEFFVEVPHGIGLLRSESFVVTDTCSSIGIGEVNVESFNIYPNPTTDIIYVTGVTTGTDYEVTNILGQKTLEGTLTENFEIDLSNQRSGIFFLRINNTVQRIAKQ